MASGKTSMNALELTGRATTHLVKVNAFDTFLQLSVWDAFQEMAKAALCDGIEIKIVSGYRDFERQLYLWNRKMLGKSDLLDRQGNHLDVNQLNENERLRAVLTWLAMPGGSRHHWGTDLDVTDGMAAKAGYKLQLESHEYLYGGVFHRMYVWLKEHSRRWGFYFPYDADRGGVAVEPWHISYGLIAQACVNQFEPKMLEEALSDSKVEAKEYLLANMEGLFEQYIKKVAQFSLN